MEDLQRQISAKVIALNSSDSPSQSTSEHKQEQQAEQLKTLQRIEKLQEQIHQLTEVGLCVFVTRAFQSYAGGQASRWNSMWYSHPTGLSVEIYKHWDIYREKKKKSMNIEI